MTHHLLQWSQRLLANKTVAKLLHSSLVRSVSGSFAIQIFSLGIRFLTSLLLARLLTTRDYGTFNYTLSWILTLAVPATLGFDLLLVREIAAYQATQNWKLMRGLIQVSTAIGLSLSVVMVVILFAYSDLQSAKLADVFLIPPGKLIILVNRVELQVLRIGLFLLPLMVILSIQKQIMQGLGAIVRSQLPRMVLSPLLFIIFFVAAYLIQNNALTAPQLMALRVLAFVCAILGSMYWLRQTLPPALGEVVPSYAEVGTWLRRAMPMLGTTLLISLYARLDILMLGALRGSEDVAVYGVVLVLSNLVVMILSASNVSLGPRFSQLYAVGQIDELRRLVNRSARGILFSSLPIVVGLIVGGNFLLSLFGAAYVIGYPILVILVIGQFVNMATGPVGTLLVMTGYEGLHLDRADYWACRLFCAESAAYPAVGWGWGCSGNGG